MLGGHIGQRRFRREHPFDVVQSHAELSQGAGQPGPGDGVRPEQPAAVTPDRT
jgi:hypothetical protein